MTDPGKGGTVGEGGIRSARFLPQPRRTSPRPQPDAQPEELAPAREPEPEETQEAEPPLCAVCLKAASQSGSALVAGPGSP